MTAGQSNSNDSTPQMSLACERPLALLRACPVYQASPLIGLSLDTKISILAKIESNRLGLGSFKALGGMYAVAKLISESFEEKTGRKLEPEEMLAPEVGAHAGSMTFVCASAGNHGIAVATGAALFGAAARVHLSATVPEGFERQLLEKGAVVIRSGRTYEESMTAALTDADETGAIMLADSSWINYYHAPSLVMEGYTVLAEELRESFEASNQWPTQVYLQAGVGGLAAAIAYMIRNNWREQPEIIVVEPDAAPCLRESLRAGRAVRVSGPVSNMGRLDCKEPSLLALNSLARTADRFMVVSDEEAEKAAAMLEGNSVRTTPSGAAGLAAVFKESFLNLPEKRALIVVSEGSV